jgi:hypothetical protein
VLGEDGAGRRHGGAEENRDSIEAATDLSPTVIPCAQDYMAQVPTATNLPPGMTSPKHL